MQSQNSAHHRPHQKLERYRYPLLHTSQQMPPPGHRHNDDNQLNSAPEEASEMASLASASSKSLLSPRGTHLKNDGRHHKSHLPIPPQNEIPHGLTPQQWEPYPPPSCVSPNWIDVRHEGLYPLSRLASLPPSPYLPSFILLSILKRDIFNLILCYALTLTPS